MLLYALLLFIPLAVIAWQRLHKSILHQLTALLDIQEAGVPRKPNERIPGRAVIVGGSVTGLCMARVLSDHFEQVTIIEAEEVSTDPSVPRTRLQQWDQVHVFLPILHKALQRLFPTFDAEIVRAGVVFERLLPIQPVYRFKGFMRNPPIEQSKMVWLSMGRENFETTLRKLVKQDCKNVETIHATATGMLMSTNRESVQEIEYRSGTATNSMACSLVVDASGPARVGAKWLKRLGFVMPEESDYSPHLRYSTWDWAVTPATVARLNEEAGLPEPFDTLGSLGASLDQGDGCDATVFQNLGNGICRGMCITVEGASNEPETIEDLRRMHASHTHLPWARKAMEMIWEAYEAEHGGVHPAPKKVSLGACYNTRYSAKNLPTNYIPAGDAVLRLNPVFAQGCTKAMIDALTLDHVFRKRPMDPRIPQDLVSRFLPLHASRLDGMYDMTKIMDYANATTEPTKGEGHSHGHFMRKFQHFIFQASFRDPSGALGGYITNVTSMLDHPLNLFSPVFLARCTWAYITGPQPEFS